MAAPHAATAFSVALVAQPGQRRHSQTRPAALLQNPSLGLTGHIILAYYLLLGMVTFR